MSVDGANVCPSCRAPRPAMGAVCPDCGYVYTTANAVVISDLSERLDALVEQGLSGKAYNDCAVEIIRNFQIPHIKEEVLDIMYYIQPKALEKASPVSLAWRARQREVFERAKSVCAGDKANLAKVSAYESSFKAKADNKLLNWWQLTPMYAKALMAAALIFVILLLIPAKDVSPQAYALRFAEAVKSAEWEDAMEYLVKCPAMGTLISDNFVLLLESLIKESRMIEAENVVKHYRQFIPSDSKELISRMRHLFIDKYIGDGNIEKAMQFVDTSVAEELGTILKAYIESANESAALAFYRRYSSKFSKYDYQQHCKVFLLNDPVVLEFLESHGIKVK